MRWLLTSDWQAEWENLDLCEKAKQQVLRLCEERKLEGIAVVGDLKKAYNPVDCRVTQFWTDFIYEATDKLGLRFIIVLGNHDRVGMYGEAQNWLPILERAGARVVHQEPRVFGTKGGGALYCLPFSSSIEQTKEWAKWLHRQHHDDRTRVLLFHNDLFGSAYNILGQKSDAKLRPDDLYPGDYGKCYGGHIHMHQCVTGNVYYLGSPFATDWGEANQRKGFVVIEGTNCSFVKSEIPGWYDPAWPNFPKFQKDWKGSRIRLHVPLEVGQNYPALLEKARIEAEKKYLGATIYTVPEFQEEKQAVSQFSVTDPDSVKISAYVDETLPDSLSKHHDAVNSYLCYKLNKASQGLGLRPGSKITFVSAKAKRFLSYEDLDLDFTQKGLFLVTGKNRDWMGRSNGSGKTNYLQTIPVALFGRTFKEQKHDGWACDKRKGEAWVSLHLRDSKNRRVKVFRTRRPGKLQLWLDGKEQSSGMQSTSQAGTQGLVEKLSGYTWQTLANAVYIDQEQVNQFLNGTPAAQKKILERFQNLERFTKAQELITKDVRMKGIALYDAASEKDTAEATVAAYQDVLDEQEMPIEVDDAKEKLELAREALKEVEKKQASAVVRLDAKRQRCERRVEHLEGKRKALVTHLRSSEVRESVLNERIQEATRALGGARCPVCQQPVDADHLQKHIDNWQHSIHIARKEIKRLREEREGINDEIDLLSNESARLHNMKNEYAEMVEDAYSRVNKCMDKNHEAKTRWQEEQDKRRKLKRKIRDAKRQVAFWTSQIDILTEEKGILDYCLNAFSRNGVPAFLNAQICPSLNRAAEYYAEVFTGKEIQVRFAVKEAEFEVEVINAHGGKTVVDQSAGEKKMAAIIASFALRTIAPPCNLLVLDEPGDGLDAVNAKAFASGLKKLQGESGMILLTTHNQHILSELSGEKTITIEKKNGVSRVV